MVGLGDGGKTIYPNINGGQFRAEVLQQSLHIRHDVAIQLLCDTAFYHNVFLVEHGRIEHGDQKSVIYLIGEDVPIFIGHGIPQFLFFGKGGFAVANQVCPPFLLFQTQI